MPARNTLVQLLSLYTDPESHNAQRHRQTDRRTHRRQDGANSRSCCVAVRSAKKMVFTPVSSAERYCIKVVNCVLKPVHTGDKSCRKRRQIVASLSPETATNVVSGNICCQKRRLFVTVSGDNLSPFRATFVAVFGDYSFGYNFWKLLSPVSSSSCRMPLLERSCFHDFSPPGYYSYYENAFYCCIHAWWYCIST